VDLFRSIAEYAYDWIYLRALDGTLTYTSPSCLRVTGYRPRDFVEDPRLIEKIVHPEDLRLFRSHCGQEARSGAEVVPVDFRITTKDGETRWINHACAVVVDDNGKVVGHRATNRDVTRGKELEEEVRNLARFPEENPNPVLRATCGGSVVYSNGAGRALIETWMRAEGSPLPRAMRKAIADAYSAGVRARADIRCADRIYSFEAVRPANALYVNIYGMDVTEHRQMEESLRVTRDALDQEVHERTADLSRTNRLLRMISACNQALIAIDDENELVQAICQLILDEGGFRMVWVGYAEQDGDRLIRPVASAGFEEGYLESAAISWADSVRGRGPTGTAVRECRACVGRDFLSDVELGPWRAEALSRGFRSSIALPLVSQGRAFGALTIYSVEPAAFDQEMTLLSELAGDLAFGILAVRARAQRDQAQKTLEQRTVLLRSLAAELVQAEERERRRIGGVLHDQLQQLLAGARFGLESLRSADAREDLSPTIDKIDGIIKECLAVSRSLTTELSPPIQYDAELESVMQWLVAWAGERFGLRVTLDAKDGVRVESEEARMTLFRAVQELLFNVAKHSGVKDALIITARKGDRVLVTVRDAGKGFDVSASRLGGGTCGGFGLFSLHERLEALGGAMKIESAPGKGSSFTVSVPVAPVASAEEERKPEALQPESPATVAARGKCPDQSPPHAPRIRVLLVDDHLVVRQGLAMVLAGEPDIEIVGEASDGSSAVDLARRLRPDVVTMDVGLPGMNGIEATRALHAELPEIAIIGLSMFEDQGDAMLAAGAVGYLPKTGASFNLLATIRSVCRKTPTKKIIPS
jgi:PAS domain S-box-containing protein